MKNIYDTIKAYGMTVFAVIALLLSFSFFPAGNGNSANNSKAKISVCRTDTGQCPAEDYNFQSEFCRNALPIVNSSRHEKNSNPPLHRVNAALFNRTFIEFSTTFRICRSNTEFSVFQKYLKSSIPVRAGPFSC